MRGWLDLGALFTPSEKTKLAGIESAATADQTGAEIKTAYEAEANAYTDTKNTKLTGIATGADVTGDNAPQAHGASAHTDRTRTIFLSAGDAHFSDGAPSYKGLTFDTATKEDSQFKFKLPEDFVSISDIKIIGYRSGGVTGGVVFDVSVWFGDMLSGSETYGAHSNTDLDIIIPISSANIIATDVNNSVLANVTKTDLITFKLERDVDHASDDLAVDYIVAGILITYMADM